MSKLSDKLTRPNFQSTSDGWRGCIARDFIFSNLEFMAGALARYLIKDLNERRIVIGHDTRFMGREFSDFVADTMCGFGIDTYIIDRPSPTPTLTYAVNKFGFPMGINITASHNPFFYNGVKVRMGYGGVPSDKTIKRIESYFGKNTRQSAIRGSVKKINPFNDYFSQIRKMVRIDTDRRRLKILVDTMHGTTAGILDSIFLNTNVSIDYINQDFDPYFGGYNPEPKLETTRDLQNIVNKKRYDIGIAHDGDGDRIILSLPNYGYVSPHDIAAILVWYLVKYKNMDGVVLGSSTLGRRTSIVCNKLGLKYQEIPVGFKNAIKMMLDKKILLAAEENGGIGLGFYLPERDATLIAAMLIEVELLVKGGLDRILAEIEQITGKSGFCRFNYSSKIDRQALFKRLLKLNKGNFGFGDIDSISTMDGIKVKYKNSNWFSVRVSGTENILRIYCESNNKANADKMKDVIIKNIKKLDG